MNIAKIWCIYALVDPNTELVRYIGWTYNAEKRLKSHILTARRLKTHKGYWITSLLDSSQIPRMIILESGDQDWEEAEKRWIAYHRSIGSPLTNATDGGEGTPGFYPSEETRQKMSVSHTGMKQSPESISKTRAALIGRKFSPEHIAALSAVRKGKIPFSATAAAAKSNKGRKQSPEHIAKRFQFPKKRIASRILTDDQVRRIRSTDGIISIRKIANEYGVGQTLIHNVRRHIAYQDVPNLI